MTDFKLTQLDNLVTISEGVSDERFGNYPNKRPISELLNYGLILLDKPSGNTSHEIVSYVKRILQLEKAGHSGTLDPGTTGLLPIGLEEGTKIIPVLLLGPKEYIALGRLHSHVSDSKLSQVILEFTGPIYQKPPQRSSVKRQTRVRNIYKFDLDDQYDRLLLLRVLCESGTYIRKLIYDMGEVLGVGASMIELRRTKVCDFTNESNFVRLHDLVDAFQIYKETKNEEKLRRIVLPIEIAMTHLPAVTIRDTAIDALCHGAQLAMPGVVSISKDIKKGDLVGIYSLKGEIVGLGVSMLDFEEFFNKKKGICFQIKRIVMKPSTYPKFWSTTTTDTEGNTNSEALEKPDHYSTEEEEEEDSESIFSDNNK